MLASVSDILKARYGDIAASRARLRNTVAVVVLVFTQQVVGGQTRACWAELVKNQDKDEQKTSSAVPRGYLYW